MYRHNLIYIFSGTKRPVRNKQIPKRFGEFVVEEIGRVTGRGRGRGGRIRASKSKRGGSCSGRASKAANPERTVRPITLPTSGIYF